MRFLGTNRNQHRRADVFYRLSLRGESSDDRSAVRRPTFHRCDATIDHHRLLLQPRALNEPRLAQTGHHDLGSLDLDSHVLCRRRVRSSYKSYDLFDVLRFRMADRHGSIVMLQQLEHRRANDLASAHYYSCRSFNLRAGRSNQFQATMRCARNEATIQISMGEQTCIEVRQSNRRTVTAMRGKVHRWILPIDILIR